MWMKYIQAMKQLTRLIGKLDDSIEFVKLGDLNLQTHKLKRQAA